MGSVIIAREKCEMFDFQPGRPLIRGFYSYEGEQRISKTNQCFLIELNCSPNCLSLISHLSLDKLIVTPCIRETVSQVVKLGIQSHLDGDVWSALVLASC